MEQNAENIDFSEDQAADLAAIHAAAAQDTGPDILSGMPAQADNREQIAGEMAGLILALVQITKPVFPSLESIYTEDTAHAAAQAVAAVCVKHGWLQEGITGGHSEEIAAAMILLPLGFATYRGIKGDLAAMKPKKEPAQVGDISAQSFNAQPATESPGAKTVTVGAPMAGGGNADQ